MRQDRFLTAILAGIGILMLLSLSLYFLRRVDLTYGAEDTPSGVLRNYIIALQKRDVERAYTYLADQDNKPSLAAFRAPLESYLYRELSTTAVRIVEESVQGDEATVTVQLVRGQNQPFNTSFRETQTATLVRQGGAWKISSAPYPYWAYEWYAPEPVKPVTP
ncbi:hypothetical protein [Anaerolinea sp.]|uniref:hypothetical protein n=1 Tax=Anaerolinea sp. TaxID=1872519 RepID=UPI00262AEF17|nr:hypothetical protein [uncultured Anaerolinea sp.]